MFYFNLKSKTDTSGKMSLYSALSIVTVIIICAAAWNLLNLAKTTYLNTLKGSGKKIPNHIETQPENIHQNRLLRKLFVGYHLAKAKLENINAQALLKENEIKAAQVLKKYAKAQEIYKEHYGYYAADASELIIDKNGKHIIIDPKLKVLNASYNKENPAHGYYYVELVKKGPEGRPVGFFLSAVPAQYGISGLNTFCINEQAQVLKKNTGGKPVFEILSIDSSWQNL